MLRRRNSDRRALQLAKHSLSLFHCPLRAATYRFRESVSLTLAIKFGDFKETRWPYEHSSPRAAPSLWMRAIRCGVLFICFRAGPNAYCRMNERLHTFFLNILRRGRAGRISTLCIVVIADRRCPKPLRSAPIAGCGETTAMRSARHAGRSPIRKRPCASSAGRS